MAKEAELQTTDQEMEEEKSTNGGAPLEMAVLTVFKKGSILKNIIFNSPQSPELRRDDEQRFLIGRHPDCHVVLDHPSISRFHVELLLHAPSRKLVVTDLSSVHGTWVLGRRIEPHVAVELREGETLKFGASTRVYVSRWVPPGGELEWEKILEPLSEEKEETLQEEEEIDKISSSSIKISAREIDNISPRASEEKGSPADVEELQRLAGKSPVGEDYSPPRSEKKMVPSHLLSRRMKSISHLQIQSSGETKEGGALDLEKVEELAPKVLFSSNSDDEDEVHFSDKENVTPGGTSNGKTKKKATGSIHRSCSKLGDGEDGQGISGDPNLDGSLRKLLEEAWDSDREPWTPEGSSLCQKKIKEEKKEEGMSAENKENQTPNSLASSKVKRKPLSGSCQRINSLITKKRVERVPFQSLLDNCIGNSPTSSVSSPYTSSCSVGLEQEGSITALSGSCQRINSLITKKRVERVPFQSLLDNCIGNSPTSNVSSYTSPCSVDLEQEGSISGNKMKKSAKSPSTPNSEGIKVDITGRVSNRKRCEGGDVERVPFQPLRPTSSQKTSDKNGEVKNPILERAPFQAPPVDSCIREGNSTGSGDPWKAGYPRDRTEILSQIRPGKQQLLPSATKKIKWNMIADMSCFTDDESRRCLQLLEGVRGTHLIIPRTVIRELDHLKRNESLFRRATKASTTLQWIEECVANSGWWIHVQNSLGEMVPVAPTPPASPEMGGKDMDNFGFLPKSKLSSCWESLAEIISPTIEDHILQSALLFKRITKADEQIVLLTNSTALMVKAMEEGLLCETPKEFRATLVDPYSERFLWVESSPRGPTWSLSEEVEKTKSLYHHNPTIVRKPTITKAGENTARGLKLILLHNSKYGKMSTVT